MALSPARCLLLSAWLAAVAPAAPARACTTFALSRGGILLVAKSYDFDVSHGLLFVNKRNVAKQALLISAGQVKPARWVSRHGSVTFNQYGREMPLGGMNEKGLVVEIMWLAGTRHPPLSPGKETVNELQLIQYMLDMTSTVPQAVAAAGRLQVDRGYAPVHYMVCDRRGDCATIEHIEGKQIIREGKGLPFRVLANHTYDESVTFVRRLEGLGGHQPRPGGVGSLARFGRAAWHEKSFKKSKARPVPYAFGALESVHNGDFTKWQIVYEPRAGKIHFRTGREKAHTTIDAGAQDYTCGTEVKVMDIYGTFTAGHKEGRRSFRPYKPELNLDLVQRSFAELKAPLPPPVLQMIAAFPEQTRCAIKR